MVSHKHTISQQSQQKHQILEKICLTERFGNQRKKKWQFQLMIHMRQNYQSMMIRSNWKWLTRDQFNDRLPRRRKFLDPEAKKLISISFCILLLKINAPNKMGIVIVLLNDQGLSIRPKTKIIYMPLLDMVPANPTNLQTSMTHAKKLSFENGQRFSLYMRPTLLLYCS